MDSNPATIHLRGEQKTQLVSCSPFRQTSSPQPIIRKKTVNTISKAKRMQLSLTRVYKSTLLFRSSMVVTRERETMAMAMRAIEGGVKMEEMTSPYMLSRTRRMAAISMLYFFIRSKQILQQYWLLGHVQHGQVTLYEHSKAIGLKSTKSHPIPHVIASQFKIGLLQMAQRLPSQKYYHNDYKKMIGLDQTRTASEKLLDKAIGGIRAAPETAPKPVEKKVKEETVSLTHEEVLAKLVKNIQGNKTAPKVVKPLSILKKCLNDQSFTSAPAINNKEQWQTLGRLLMSVDEKLLGNYSQIGAVIDCLVDILQKIIPLLTKLQGNHEDLKQQQGIILKQEQGKEESAETTQFLDVLALHLIYLKLYTDDSFAFNKLLLEFKGKLYRLAELKAQGKRETSPQGILIKLFSLPHDKYEWLKASLSQFLKEFNITYKHILGEEQLSTYLRAYNEFINQKGRKVQGESVNIFGSSSKGAKVATIEMGPVDGLDKWTSKQ